jgi:two-component system cell cycle response regulator CtrA
MNEGAANALIASLRQALEVTQLRAEVAEEKLRIIAEGFEVWQLPGGEPVPLTVAERAICRTLFERRPSTISKEGLMCALYAARPGDQPEIKIVDVLVCKARKKLKLTRWRIETDWGVGYRMVEVEQHEAQAA